MPEKLITYHYLHVNDQDAAKFLQGQVTCDVFQTNEIPSYGACCNIQGRVISFFEIARHHDNFYLSMPADVIEKTLAHLKKFAIFSKVVLSILQESPLLFHRSSPIEAVQQGIPEVYIETSELFLPHEINLPEIGAVSFTKGCYQGQEIVARMHYRGTLKQHLQHAVLNTTEPPTPGTKILADNKVMGYVVRSALQNDHVECLVTVKDAALKVKNIYLEDSNFTSVSLTSSAC